MKFFKRLSFSFGKRSSSSEDDSDVNPCDTVLPTDFVESYEYSLPTVRMSFEEEAKTDLVRYSTEELIEELLLRLGGPPDYPPPDCPSPDNQSSEPKEKKKNKKPRVKRVPRKRPVSTKKDTSSPPPTELVEEPIPTVVKCEPTKTPVENKTMQQILEESPVFRKYQELLG